MTSCLLLITGFNAAYFAAGLGLVPLQPELSFTPNCDGMPGVLVVAQQSRWGFEGERVVIDFENGSEAPREATVTVDGTVVYRVRRLTKTGASPEERK